MRIFQLLIVCISLFSLCSYGQATKSKNTIVSGRVIDKQDNSTLPGATIVLSSGKYTVSNQNGQYEFLNLQSGKFTLKVSYIGYQEYVAEIAVEEGQHLSVDLLLETETEMLENIIIVTDRLKGEAKALNQQKTNATISNVISADQVGRFPDSNVGDALKRVTGITMQNDQGEARNIIIRGLAPNLNSVTLNGGRIPSAEGDNRNVQMDLIPADMIATIEVNKTLTPDMDADAIGGSVDLITRASPLKERITASLAGGYSPIRDKGNYSGSFVYGNRFLDSKLGMVFSGSYNSNNFGSDNIEAVWAKDKFDNVYVSDQDIRKYDIQRVRRSVSAAFDYTLNEDHSLYFNAIYNWRDDRENRYRERYKAMKPIYDDENNITGFKGDIRRETKGGIDNGRNKNTRLEDQRVSIYSLGGQHLMNNTLAMDWNVSYSSASEDRPNERYIDYHVKGTSMTQDLSNAEKPFIIAPGDVLDNYKLRTLTENHNFTKEQEWGAKINFRMPLSAIEDQKGRLRFGLRLRAKDKRRDNMFYKFTPINNPSIGLLRTVPNFYFSGSGFQPGSKYAPGYFAQNTYLGSLDLNNSALFGKEAVPGEYLAQNYKANENIYATYIRWDQDFSDKLTMIVGARIELTAIDYVGNYVEDEENLVGEVNNKFNYTNVLPSITFKYSTDSNWVYRTAFTTALARPDYYALAPYIAVSSQDNELKAGNPNLKATYSYNFDLMVEKYFGSIGMFSAGVFYKNLANFIYTYNNTAYTHDNFNQDFQGQVNPIQGTDVWNFTQQRNGDKVNLYGFEVGVQRQLDFIDGAFFKGLGVMANYTYTHSKAKGISNEEGDFRENVQLPGTSPHMFNTSLSWENSKFSVRASFNYSSDYLDGLSSSSFYDSYYDKQMFLDINASYKISKQFSVFAQANNLTNQPLRYYQGQSARTQSVEYYQSKFTIGAKFDL